MTDRLRAAWKRRVWIHLLRRFHPEIEVPLLTGVVRVDLRDEIIGRLVYLEGQYEAELQRLMAAMDLAGGVCVDVGANIGLHSMAMSRLAKRVYSFEPESHNFRLLQRNLERNGIRNVTALRSAAGDREGSCRLAVHPSNYGDHRIAVGDSTVRTQETPMTTLDTALRDMPAGAIKLIKIDVQGFECNVIRGMRETLRRNPDTFLILEVFPEGLAGAGASASELVATVRDLGWNGWEFHDFRLIPLLEPWAYDLIRGGKYADLVLSRDGRSITEVLEKMYGQSLGRGVRESVTA